MPASHETVDQRLHFVHQEGGQVFKYASRKMFEVCRDLLERNHLKVEDVGIMIPHQANKRIIMAAGERLGIAPERVMINIERYGNTTAGTLPLATRDAISEGRLKKGDIVLFAAVGAGYTVGASLWRWAVLMNARQGRIGVALIGGPPGLTRGDFLDSQADRLAPRHVQLQDSTAIGVGLEDLFVVDLHLIGVPGCSPRMKTASSSSSVTRNLRARLREADHRLFERDRLRIELRAERRQCAPCENICITPSK